MNEAIFYTHTPKNEVLLEAPFADSSGIPGIVDITESLIHETTGISRAQARATSACRLLLCIVQIDKSIYIGKTNAVGRG